MSYCVQCGVKLADTEKNCPLCGTSVHNPNVEVPPAAKPTYPAQPFSPIAIRAQRNTVLLITAVVMLIPVLTTLISDLSISGSVTWSRYVLAGFLMAYAGVFPPFLIRRHPFRFSLLIDTCCVSLVLYAICRWTGGGWFVPFALPVTLTFALLFGLAALIIRHSPWQVLVNSAVIIASIGLFVLLVENMVNEVFYPGRIINWSLYVVIPCAVFSGVLAIINSNKDVKDWLHKKLFF